MAAQALEEVAMSKQIIVVGLRVQAAPADDMVLAPDVGGGATLNGSPITSLAHLPGGLAAVECGDQLVILPWSLLTQLLNRAASAAQPGGQP
jgi:hypothetical protein